MRSLTTAENVQLAKLYRSRYKYVHNFPYLNPADIKAYQFKRIQQLISLAYEMTPFYRAKYDAYSVHPGDIKTWDDFKMLPTTTKEEIIAHHDECMVRPKEAADTIISRSSGSSGEFIEVVLSGQYFIEEALITLRMFRHAFEYEPSDVQALIYTSMYPYQSIGDSYKATYLNTLTPTRDLIDELLQIDPGVIVAYPSVLLEITKQLRAHEQGRLRPKAISTNSEQSTKHQREYISNFFGCPVFDEYSSEELSRIAFQCAQGRYHLQEDCSYIEVLKPGADTELPNGEIGEITGTCLLSGTMPFIRYRQGDTGVIRDSPCSCKSSARVLSKIAGRKNSTFILEDGRRLSSGRLLDWTYKLVLNFKLPILQFELVQTDLRRATFNIIPSGDIDFAQAQRVVRDSFRSEFGNELEVRLNLVTEIPKTPAGKHLPIKCMV